MTENIDREALQDEIDSNYEKFKSMNFSRRDKGKFALMRKGEVVEIMTTKDDAHKLGRQLYPDNIYSIQQIHPDKHDLGFMSYAL